ncbi:unnamed protein product [Linum trigynum]|uniref:Secreted protein n=1 Tax=Linum trigynum TaxID=586398 RepID=A0AAV2FJH7_9ROSI
MDRATSFDTGLRTVLLSLTTTPTASSACVQATRGRPTTVLGPRLVTSSRRDSEKFNDLAFFNTGGSYF